jgi:CRP-like cAMP-binding protein
MFLERHADKVDVLRTIPLLGSLSKKHLDLIARHADEVTVPAGKVLTRQGGLCREFFVVLEGRARVEQGGKKIATVRSGEMLGEMSLIDNKPRVATVITETPMTLLVIEARAFGTLIDEVPELRKKLLVTLCERLRAADAKLALRN